MSFNPNAPDATAEVDPNCPVFFKHPPLYLLGNGVAVFPVSRFTALPVVRKGWGGCPQGGPAQAHAGDDEGGGGGFNAVAAGMSVRHFQTFTTFGGSIAAKLAAKLRQSCGKAGSTTAAQLRSTDGSGKAGGKVVAKWRHGGMAAKRGGMAAWWQSGGKVDLVRGASVTGVSEPIKMGARIVYDYRVSKQGERQQ
eukprot:gene14303-biopygen5333